MTRALSGAAVYKPHNWPKGLTVALHKSTKQQEGLRSASFMINKGQSLGSIRIPFYESNYVAARREALKTLAKHWGYKKIPSTWEKSVGKTHAQMCKQHRLKSHKVTITLYERACE